jgi:phospholipase/carboxylesterase
MKTEKLGPLNVRLCGGTDGDGGGDGPLVVLLHGFGAPGDDLVPLWRVLSAPKRARFAFPAAPIALTDPGFMGDARAWWEIDIMRLQMELMRGSVDRLVREVPEGLTEAREALVATLDALGERLGVAPESVYLGGFSQGAMLSCDAVLRTERPFAGLILMSGTLIAEDEWRSLMPKRAGLKVFQSHGTHDPILPYANAERLRDALSSAGLSVSFHGFRGQHEIPATALAALAAWW